jgi:hypothetical protein
LIRFDGEGFPNHGQEIKAGVDDAGLVSSWKTS